MSTTKSLKKALSYLGFNPENGKPSITLAIFLFTTASLIIDTIYFLIDKWTDVDRRFHGIQTIIFYLILGFQCTLYIINWNDMLLVIKVLDASHYIFPFQVSNERQHLLNTTKKGMQTTTTLWNYAIQICVGAGIIFPGLLSIKQLITNGMADVTVEELPQAFPIYYPKDYKTLSGYVFGYILQTIFYLGGALSGYLGLAGTLLSMQLISGEVKLLRLSIEEMDDILAKNNVIHKAQVNNVNSTNKNDISMKSFLHYFVDHHLSIQRKMADINKGTQVVAFIVNFGVSVYVCLGILIIVKSDNLILKLQEIFICVLWSLDIYCYDYMGENITTENDKLHKALYNSSWPDKPQWFKKSVHILMMRTGIPMEFKPGGLFVLNLRNYAKFINAAYSYYNLLNHAN